MWKQSNNMNDQVLRQFYNQRRKRNQNVKHHNLLKKNVSYFQQLQQNYQQSQIIASSQQKNQQSFSEQFQLSNARKTLEKPKNIEPQQYGGLQRQNNYFSQYQLKRAYNYIEQPIPTFGTIHKETLDQDYSNSTSRQRSFSNPFNKIKETFNDSNKENLQVNDFRKTKKNSQSMGKKYSQCYEIPMIEQQPETYNQMPHRQVPKIEAKDSIQHQQEKIQYDIQYIKELQNKIKFQDKFIQSIQKMRRAIQKVDENCSLKDLWRWIKKLPQKQYE